MVGESIDEFTFLKELGEGGMAKVYLAEDNSFKDKVAVKVLKPQYVYHPNIRKRFIDEARKLHRIDHPNIIKVRRIIDAGDVVAFAMDYVQGETIEDYIGQSGSLSFKQIKDIFLEVLKAVRYVHKQDIIHRDIKPSNFMIEDNGNIILLDFGIAKDTSGSSEYTATAAGQQMGTPTYMSPEQVKDSKDLGVQSDIYSLGVLLWFMVTKKVPYVQLSLYELYEKIVKEPLPSTDSNWDKIIDSATKKYTHERISDCDTFINMIESLSPVTPISRQSDGKEGNLNVMTAILFGVWVIYKFGDKEYGFISICIGAGSIIYGIANWIKK